jgi:hypothetical protein
MTMEPQSFRHRFVSLYQSAVDEVVRSTSGLLTSASNSALFLRLRSEHVFP